MAKRNDDVEAWLAEFERTGRIEFRLARRRLVLLTAAGVLFLVLGIAMAVSASAPSDRFWGGLAALMGAGCIVVFRKQLVQKTPAVAVDVRGVHASYPWHGERLIPWNEVLGTTVFRTRGNAVVLLLISPEFESQWLADLEAGAPGKLLAAAGRKLIGVPHIALPSPLQADPEAVASWIRMRADERRAT